MQSLNEILVTILLLFKVGQQKPKYYLYKKTKQINDSIEKGIQSDRCRQFYWADDQWMQPKSKGKKIRTYL